MRPDPDWESCAAWSLGQIGKPASGPLVALVTQTKSPAVRKEAVRALGAGKDASVVPLLLPLLDRGGEVQGAAAWALGELGDRQAVDALIGALVPWTPNRWRLAEALGKLGDKRAIHAIANSGLVTDWDHGGETIRILGSLGWKAETPADHVHVAVAGRDRPALAADWENTRKTLLADIDTGQTVAVQNALFAFILIGKEEVIPALIDLLNRKRDRERGLRIANGYLQSGNTRLASAARDWAARNDAEIFQTHSTKTQVKWGGR
jgi:HEAT repeat protein